jgi:putative MATE family efflux protein
MGLHPSDEPRRTVLSMSLWALTWPLFIELVLSLTLGLEDSFYLAKISDRAAAAVGSVLPIFGVCNVVFQTFAQSGASVAGQLLGGERHGRVNRTFLAMILLNGAFGAVGALFFFAFHRRIGHWLGLSPEVYALATEFLGLVGPMLFIQALRLACASVINARGLTRFNMMSALFVNATNLGLNHLLTRGTWGLPRLGVSGVAYSTIAAQTLGLLLSAVVVRAVVGVRWDVEGSSERAPGRRPRWRTELRDTLAPILDIALPSVVEPISFQCNQLVLVGIVVSIGDVALAARTYTLNLIVFAIVWSFSLGQGTQIKIAHLVGAGRFDEASAQLHRSVRLGMACGVVTMALLSAVARPVYGLFTHDPEVVRLGQVLMLLGLALEPCRTSNMIVGGSLRGSGDARYVSLVSVLLTWGIAIPLAYVLAVRLRLGLVGVWLAMICDELSRGLMSYRRWQTGAWRTKGVLARSGARSSPPSAASRPPAPTAPGG